MVHAPESRCITRSTTESPLPCSSGHNDRRPNSAASECHQEGCSSCSRFVIFLVSGVCPVKLRAQQMGTRYGRAFYKTGFRNCSQAALIRWIYTDWQEQQCFIQPTDSTAPADRTFALSSFQSVFQGPELSQPSSLYWKHTDNHWGQQRFVTGSVEVLLWHLRCCSFRGAGEQ